MKQLLCILLCLVLLAQLSACSGPETPETTAAAVGSQSLTERAAPTETEPRSFPVGTTLMVYLMGSDLEAKTAAGSSDLQEIAESGVDLSANQVLVCVGGSPHWHSELGSPEENRILRLTETGYVAEKTGPSRSMGDPSCLADFVNFAAEQAPSEHYALIFWDHGSGPVIGYGKDILFENDALTLAEMQQAMDQTPFREGRKLDWVGFDACLMASAELACVWAPYADYLAASQEVEPAMGWDYGFLSRLGTCGPETLLPDMAEAYLAACRAYYQQKDFDERDTTLSVMDLSGAEALHEAVEALFAAAGEDVGEAYDQLAAARSETRALGRASTGIFGNLLRYFEMYFWEGFSQNRQLWNYRWNSFWCVFVSMTTVAFGDLYPKTHIGRILIIIATIIGIYFIFMSMTLITQKSILSDTELKAYKLINRLRYRTLLKDVNANIIYHSLKMIQLRKKFKKKNINNQRIYEMEFDIEKKAIFNEIENYKIFN